MDLGYAIHPNAEDVGDHQLRRYLGDASDNRAWLQDAKGGKLAAYFRSINDWKNSEKKLADRRKNN